MMHLGLNVVFICDPSHAGWRCAQEALQNAGLLAATSVAQVVFNIAYGPFQRSAFYKILQESAADMSASLGPGDNLVLFYWKEICEDFGWSAPEQMDQAARRAYISSLTELAPAAMKGPKASSSRFFSFVQAFRAWDQYHHTKLLIVTFVAIRLGWAKTVADFWAQANDSTHSSTGERPLSDSGTAIADIAPAKAGAARAATSSGQERKSSAPAGSRTETSANASSSSAAASSAAPSGVAAVLPGGGAGATSGAKAKEQAREATNQERNKSANTLHAVARLLFNTDFTRQIRSIGLATNPLALAYSKAYHDIREVDKVKSYYAGWAHWSTWGVK